MKSSLLKVILASCIVAGLAGCGGDDNTAANSSSAAKAPSSAPPPISGDMPAAPK